MITLNQKQLQEVVDTAALAGRLDELNRLEGYVPSAHLSRRKNILKKQLSDLLDKEEKKQEETVINLRIEVPSEEKSSKKEKTTKFNLKDFLSGKIQEETSDEEEVITVFRNLLPVETRTIIGKVVKEL